MAPPTHLDPADADSPDGGRVPPVEVAEGADDYDAHLVRDLLEAHRETQRHAQALALARQRRRELAGALHASGRSYRWIGNVLGLSPQAVEGFVHYKRRHPSNPVQ